MLHTEILVSSLVLSLLRRIRAHRAASEFRSLPTELSAQRARHPDADLPRLLRQCVLYLTVLAGYAGSFRYCRVHIHKHFPAGPDPSAAPSSLRSKAYGVFLNFTISFLKQSRYCGRRRFPCRESHGESCLLDRQLQCALARCNNLPAILLTDHRTRVDIKKNSMPTR